MFECVIRHINNYYFIHISETSCGRPFEYQDIMPDHQVTVSSKEQDNILVHTSLYSTKSWCAAEDDMNPFIKVNISNTTPSILM